MNKILIDTNILVYSVDEDSKYFRKAQSILFDTSEQLYTTSKNLSEFLVVVTRFPKKALSIPESLKLLKDFTSFITVLYPSSASYKLFQELLEKYHPTGLKIHDYEIASIAIAHKIINIATFNEKDFIDIEEIEIYSN